jgi:hypothetical protein
VGAKTLLSIGSGPGMSLATAERFASEGLYPGTKEAEAVADLFWRLHSQPKGSGTVEAQYLA